MEYKYQAKTQLGQFIEGTIEAPDEDNAINILHGKNYTILSFEAVSKGLFAVDLNQIFAKPNSADVIVFTRQFSTLIEANMPIAESLRTLARQLEKPTFQKVASNIAEMVEGGSPLSSALSEYPKLFSPFYVKLVKSGETTGKLHEALSYLADYLERSDSINSKIKSALSYPAFVVFALVVVGGIMAIYVLPKLLVIFKESNITDLPLTTKILIWGTDFINAYIWYMIPIIAVGIYLIWNYVKTPAGRAQWDNLKITVPSIGKVIRNLYLARMAESLSTLIKAQIPILDSLKITADLVGNTYYRNVLLAAEESVRGGGNMSDVFNQYKEVPPMFSSMIAIGERTGKIDTMMEHVSKFYKESSENDIANITTLIEPILIFVLGIAVAALVSGILLPIYGLVNAG